MTKKVLMIAYAFPPMGGPGVQRTLKFAKYLPEHAWRPIILTSDGGAHEHRGEADYSLLEEIPECARVIRAPDPRFRRVLSTATRGWRGVRCQSRDGRRQTLGAYGSAIAKSLLFVPDAQAEWMPLALMVAMRVLRRCRVDAIWSTSDPFSNHVVAYALKRLFGAPWVADWRDPWTLNQRYEQRFAWRQRVDRKLEGTLLRGADRVIVTCSAFGDALLSAYPSLESARILEITNGYDPEDFDAGWARGNGDQRLTITFAGRFQSPHNWAVGFLDALKKLKSEGFDRRALNFRVVGAHGAALQQLMESLGVQDMVELIGYRPHRQCTKLLVESDVLLLSVAAGRGHDLIYPGKLFEYLRTGKPILALVAPGATADLLARLGAGLIVPPNDVSKIADAVRGLHRAKRMGCLPTFDLQDVIGIFDRRALAGTLARCLDEVSKDAYRGKA